MRILAAQRLKAVNVRPDVLSEAQAEEDIAVFQRWLKVGAKKLGRDKNGLTYYWLKRGVLVCVDAGQIVGFIKVRPSTVEAKGGELKVMQVDLMYLRKAYRGKGIILGMHQYLITKFNLLSDYAYSPEGFNVWKQMAKIHNVETVRGTDWTDSRTLLLIRRGQ